MVFSVFILDRTLRGNYRALARILNQISFKTKEINVF